LKLFKYENNVQPKHKKESIMPKNSRTRKQIKDKTKIRKKYVLLPSVYIKFFMQQTGYYKDNYML
jgi:hypothetical protein